MTVKPTHRNLACLISGALAVDDIGVRTLKVLDLAPVDRVEGTRLSLKWGSQHFLIEVVEYDGKS